MLAAAVAVLLALAASNAASDDSPRHPVPASPVRAMPSLARSDPMVREALLKLDGGEALAPLLASDDLIRRFVASVDEVASGGAREHAMAIRAFEGLEPGAAVPLYSRLYPLMQQAYEESSPDGYFNDRFVQAIDRLLDDAAHAPAHAKLREVRSRLALRPPGS